MIKITTTLSPRCIIHLNTYLTHCKQTDPRASKAATIEKAILELLNREFPLKFDRLTGEVKGEQ